MEIKKTLKFDLENVPQGQREEALTQVGEFLVDSILERVSDGKSPVAGRRFNKLQKKYAEEFKGGDRTPNLELTGDLLDNLTFKVIDTGIEVGYFSGASDLTLDKADGHNNFTGRSRLPTRRFIPFADEEFMPTIQRELEAIVDDFRIEKTPDEINFVPSQVATAVSLANIFDEDFIGGLFGQSNQ